MKRTTAAGLLISIVLCVACTKPGTSPNAPVTIPAPTRISPSLGGGHETGHGGGVVACPDGSVELLDFWEGKALRGLTLPAIPTPVTAPEAPRLIESALRDASARLKALGHEAMAHLVYQNAMNVYRMVQAGRYLSKDVVIAPPADARHKFVKRGCELKGVALYDDEYDTIDIDRELHDGMGILDRAGLYFHEGLYKYLRTAYLVRDSRAARAITACLFSEAGCVNLSAEEGLPAKAGLDCSTLDQSTEPTTFVLFRFVHHVAGQPRGKVTWRLQFLKHRGKRPLVKSYFDLAASELAVVGNRVEAELEPGPRHTRSAEERWENFELPLSVTLDADGDKHLRLDGAPVSCRARP
jgi:hypothetical protein